MTERFVGYAFEYRFDVHALEHIIRMAECVGQFTSEHVFDLLIARVADGLHPNQYTTRLLEEIRFPSNGNGRQVNPAPSRSQRTIESLANALVAAKAL